MCAPTHRCREVGRGMLDAVGLDEEEVLGGDSAAQPNRAAVEDLDLGQLILRET